MRYFVILLIHGLGECSETHQEGDRRIGASRQGGQGE